MTENNNLNFFDENGGLDLGGGFDDTDNPFGGMFGDDVTEEKQPDVQPDAEPKAEETPAEPIPEPPADEEKQEEVKEDKNDLQTEVSEEKSDAEKVSEPEPENPFEAAVAAAKEKKADEIKSGLKDKLPVFVYGKANEEIADPSITFDKLRYEKADDFPELDDGTAVNWKVEYGSVSKTIKDPKKTTIASVKKDIENSKNFTDALAKKKKEEDIVCKVTPTVAAKKKGLAENYKAACDSIEDAVETKKAICYVPSDDGNVYEVRNTDAGIFVAKANRANVYKKVRAGFIPALPKIPAKILEELIAFFRSYITDKHADEAMAIIYWSKKDEKYEVFVPQQRVTAHSVYATMPEVEDDNYTPVMEIHSHNKMNAFFSEIDNEDEKATRIYAVVGNLDMLFPRIKMRISVGGKFVEINPADAFEMPNGTFPQEWSENVSTGGRRDEYEA